MESGFDIDLSGDDGEELPPGVQPGSLAGTDTPPEPPTPVEPSADEVEDARSAADLDADFDAALGGDDPDGGFDVGGEMTHHEPEPEVPFAGDAGDIEGMRTQTEPEPEPEPAPEVETPVVAAPPEPKPKKAAKRAPKKAKKPAATAPATGGPPARLYFILQKVQGEVDGVLREVYQKVAFANPDDPAGPPIQGIRARNRDIALYKAGKLFGHGFEGNLLALPEGMWDEKTVRNKPRDVFKVEVG